ncbi:hypothetical protein N42_1525 [Lactococcus lactis subsp. lactis]|uniref:Uncharacterized protein n=1 Tax=Lactococcus lactis subsp. lactis TaxID=1360 RepID=A0A0V8BJH0_LACLL|nr:hypothetical protein ATCC19435_0282 [Lactococcus lactis subsp. lactis]KSU26587.1 hypothetical protein N42_1525 [Lactococcus lactis subsp. lactis]PCS19292.1 hypothetical protein RU91_GL000310 [Lactococcus lactis subsp. lactis]
MVELFVAFLAFLIVQKWGQIWGQKMNFMAYYCSNQINLRRVLKIIL